MSDKSIDTDWKNKVSAERQQAEEAAAKKAVEDQETRESAVPATFMSFLSEYAMRAMVLMGMIPYPGSDDRVIDIGGARFTIDILGVIQDKTKNNLTPEENDYLRNALYELRIRFVDVADKIAKGQLKEGPQTGSGAPAGATPAPGGGDKPKIIVP